jgi:hypothetical protein
MNVRRRLSFPPVNLFHRALITASSKIPAQMSWSNIWSKVLGGVMLHLVRLRSPSLLLLLLATLLLTRPKSPCRVEL